MFNTQFSTRGSGISSLLYRNNIFKSLKISLAFWHLKFKFAISQELLKILHGSPLDHTVLLASLFIYLGIKCWVAIGVGLPRGRSSYVLIKYDLTTRRIVLDTDQLFRSKGFLNKSDGYTWYVCDASTGQRHELRDVGCPLKTVDYVFDNENVSVQLPLYILMFYFLVFNTLSVKKEKYVIFLRASRDGTVPPTFRF